MEVRIYDRDLNFKGVIENHTSLIWTRKYYEPGNFEIHAPITEQNLRLLAKGNIISKRGSSEAGVIEDIENEESDLKNEITAKGRFLSSYMDRRLIKSTVNFSGKIEVAMRNLLSGVTAIPLVELGTLNGFTETGRVSSDYEKPYDLRNKTGKGRNDRLSLPARLPEQENYI